VCALVLGRGEEFRLIYLHRDSEEEIRTLGQQGFRHRGVIGFANGRLEMESARFAPREQTERVMRAARTEFLSALAMMAAGGTVH
jgi:hypothetical protein